MPSFWLFLFELGKDFVALVVVEQIDEFLGGKRVKQKIDSRLSQSFSSIQDLSAGPRAQLVYEIEEFFMGQGLRFGEVFFDLSELLGEGVLRVTHRVFTFQRSKSCSILPGFLKTEQGGWDGRKKGQ